MKSVIVVVVALAAYTLAAPTYSAEYFKVHEQCQADEKLRIQNMTVFEQLEYEKLPVSQVDIPANFDDHMACMYENLGLFNDNGDIIVSVAADKLKTLFSKPEVATQIVTACGGIANESDDLAETAGLFYFCTLEYYA
ncbi:uncharacterized protein LOC132708041 [Cylas formicarius]|uniref:uncharacterized protein LOC132708041 n=1 Tax=Cylas formicarius TaxID=197179 RepID=UPI0029584FEF|nr:uncharacterized protein LOC132708041 [Cylas formicarius]